MAEQRFVEPPVEGSSPSGHPNPPGGVLHRDRDQRGTVTGGVDKRVDSVVSRPAHERDSDSPSDGPEGDL